MPTTMKKAASTIMATLLALTIIYLGAGTVVVHCLRTNTVSVGSNDDDCCHNDKHCHPAKPCMKTTVLTLQPTVLCKQHIKVSLPQLSLPPTFACTALAHSFLAKYTRGAWRVADSPHAPPRLYLTLIRVLLI